MLGGPYPANLRAGVVEAIIIKTPVLATNKSREGGRGGETDHAHAHAHALDRLPQRQKDRQCQKERKETGKGRWVGKHTPNENKKWGDRKTVYTQHWSGREKEPDGGAERETETERWTNGRTAHLRVGERSDNGEPQPRPPALSRLLP